MVSSVLIIVIMGVPGAPPAPTGQRVTIVATKPAWPVMRSNV